MELSDETTAVPTRRKRCDHDLVSVGGLTSGFAKRICFSVHRRVTFLDASVMSPSKEDTPAIEKPCPDWNTTLSEAASGLFNSHIQQTTVINHGGQGLFPQWLEEFEVESDHDPHDGYNDQRNENDLLHHLEDK